jgi:hypothetical protein
MYSATYFCTPYQAKKLIENLEASGGGTEHLPLAINSFAISSCPVYKSMTAFAAASAAADLDAYATDHDLTWEIIPAVRGLFSAHWGDTIESWFSRDKWMWVVNQMMQMVAVGLLDHHRNPDRFMFLDLEPYWDSRVHGQRYPYKSQDSSLIEAMWYFWAVVRALHINLMIAPGGLPYRFIMTAPEDLRSTIMCMDEGTYSHHGAIAETSAAVQDEGFQYCPGILLKYFRDGGVYTDTLDTDAAWIWTPYALGDVGAWRELGLAEWIISQKEFAKTIVTQATITKD